MLGAVSMSRTIEELKLVTFIAEGGMRTLFGSQKMLADELVVDGLLKLVDDKHRTFEVTPKGLLTIQEYRQIPESERSSR